MFDFEKLLVYQKAKQFNAQIRLLIKQSKFDAVTKDQLRRGKFIALCFRAYKTVFHSFQLHLK